jgi:hypothetical protein
MFKSYRKGDANDADTYVAAVGAVLAEFDAEVIRRVTDPVHGLPRKLKWMPTVAEVGDECERVTAIVRGERIVAERAAQGFRWIDDRSNGKLGFYNDQGQRWEHRQKAIPPPKPLAIERMPLVERALAGAVQHIPAEMPLAPDDGRHAARIADELARRKTINTQRAAEGQVTDTEGSQPQ